MKKLLILLGLFLSVGIFAQTFPPKTFWNDITIKGKLVVLGDTIRGQRLVLQTSEVIINDTSLINYIMEHGGSLTSQTLDNSDITLTFQNNTSLSFETASPGYGFMYIGNTTQFGAFGVYADYTNISGKQALEIYSGSGTGGYLYLNPTSTIFLDQNAMPKGIEYDSDYSATYSDRSLIDKGYADDRYLLIDNVGGVEANHIIINDSSDIRTAAIKVHRIDSVNTITINTWIDVQFDTLIAAETTYGFAFNADSTGLIASSAGLYYVSGCFHTIWNGAGGVGGAGTRITVNGDEKRCAQTSIYRDNTSSDRDTKDYVGTVRLSPGDEVKLQYKVTSVNMDFEGDATFFDNPISFSMNLYKISK